MESTATFVEEDCLGVCTQLLGGASSTAGPYKDILTQSCYYLSGKTFGSSGGVTDAVRRGEGRPLGGEVQGGGGISVDDKLACKQF